MSKLRQFGLLLWKNFIIQRRKVLVTLLEIGIPCTLAIILVLIRQSVQATQYANATSWHEFSIDAIPNNLTKEAWNQPWKISWTPSNPATDGIVKTVSERLKMEYEGYGFPTEKRMVDFLVSTNGTSKNVLGGLVFTSLDPANLMYTIRLPSLSRGSTKMSIFGSETWQTEQMFPSFATVGPRSKGQDSGGKPNYWQQGFLALQQAVDRALIQHLSPSFEQGSVKIKLQRHPYPPYRDDAFVLVIQKQFTFLIMLSFVFIAQNAVKCVVHEKEKKLKESMKMMGLASYLHWGAWFFHFMVMCAITVFLITVFVSVQFGPEGKVINNTDPSIVFVYLLVYSMSTIAFAFAVSTLFKKANTGAAAGGILFFISYIPYSFIQPRYHSMSFGAKLACCLVNNLGMSMGGTVIGMFEGTGAGVQWSTIHRGASVDDSMSMLTVLIMLLVDTALYMVFTVYVEAVFPGEYGVPQPWYFPFTRTYWCGLRPSSMEVEVDAASDQYETLNVDDTPDEFFERYPVGVEPGIQIKNLRKVFKTGPRHLVAVKGMNLKFYKGQITALLGHNGAGKTTTMAMLTGFIPPTTGTAVVNGHDIREDIDGVRQSLGLCPQHDVLFDELTVLEHLRFFCRLKGLSSARIEEESEKMLKAVGLYEKRNVFSKGLSGGMKRKLSVAIALSADSKVVILDEPTSGMDPNARRQTWELLQKERADRTMVLTTHYMDEADLLGDRIAIMAEGVLKCYGTSLFLKKKYGAGYHMVIVKQPQCNVSDITSVVQGYVEAATVESNVGADLSYILPDESASQFEAMFTELEERKDQLGILSYGVSVTTMEEVFLRVGESADPELQQRLHAGTYQSDDGNSLTESQTDMPDCATSLVGPSSSDFNTGCRLYLDQLRALFYKRVLYSWRNRIVTLSQLVVPLVFTIAALAIIKTLPTPGNSPPLVLNITPYEGNNMVMATELNAGAAAEKYAGVYKGFFAEFPETVVEYINQLPVYKDDPNIDKYFIEKGIESVSRYGNRYLIGAKFETGIAADTDVDVTGYFQSQAYHTGAITLNAISNAVLRAATTDGTASLATVNHPLPRTRKEEADDELTEIMAGFTISFNVMFGMAFLSSSFILFLIKERATKSKHCQLVAGARPFVFWLATFLWDYLNYMIPCLCLFVVFAGFDVVAYTGNDRLGILLLVFILYGWAMLPFMYLSSFLFTIPSTGYVWMTMFNVFSGIATVLTVEILSIPKLNTEDISRTLEWIFLSVLPNFCFGKALETVYTNYQYLELCNTPDLVQLCQLGPFIPNFTFPCCKGYCAPNCFYYEENYMSWEQGGIGRMLAFMAVQGLAFCLILFALESDLVHRFRFWIMSRRSRMGAQVTPGEREEASLVAEDSDVAQERERIRSEEYHDDPLVMNEVVKYYNHLLAVDRLSFGISHAECFGLLGVNGAGKTTTFKMLTGDEPMTSGEAVVCGYDVTKNSAKVRRCIGYCPQYDALVDHMTGRELLTMYARLRGIKTYMIPEVVNQLLFTLTLENHADKRSDFYSGGNKRKLSTALALVGEPYIVFLDEPSSGLDPVARRLLWDALSRYRARGKTLVLTSHSMEECAALCTRIGIMVNGQFRCLGSQQHLKNKFGEGYTLIARVVYTQNQEPNVKPLMDYIQKTFPNSELKDVHQNLLHYHVPAAAATWAGIFGSIERVKDKLGIEDYSISQTTLEQVFINFARAQIAPNAAKRSFCGRIFCGGCCGCCDPPKQE